MERLLYLPPEELILGRFLPLSVFMRAYSLHYLAQYGPEYAALAGGGRPVPEGAELAEGPGP